MKFKTLIIALSTICISTVAFSQPAMPDFSTKKNVNKINILFGPFYKMAHVSYEKPIGKRFSINTTVKARPATSTSLSRFSKVSSSDGSYNPFPKMKLSAVGNVTEFRIYSKKKGALKGFYLSASLATRF